MKLTKDELLNFTANKARDVVKDCMQNSLINTLETIQSYASEGKTHVTVTPFNDMDADMLVKELFKLGYSVFLNQDGKLSIHWG